MDKKFPKGDLPLIVLSAHSHSWISAIIRIATKAYYSHAMWLVSDYVVASQDKYFKTRPLSDYMGKGGRLKFWQIKNLSKEEKAKLAKAIREDLNKKKIKTRYDWPMVLGQLLAAVFKKDGFKKIQNPYTHFCSEIIAKHLRKIGIHTLHHPSPKDLNEYFNLSKEDFRVYGWWSYERGFQKGGDK